MKRIFSLLVALIGCIPAIAAPQINESNLPVTSTVSDNDKVRIIQNGASKSAPASAIRQITASKIVDASILGRNWITTASPNAVTFARINADNTVSYLDASAFLAAIGAGSASVTIQEIDGSPSVPFNVLEVTNGTLSDQGGGVARLTIGSGGGGGTWGSITGTLSSQTDLQAALDAKQSLDQDLTDIAALSTQLFGRSLLTASSAGAAQITLGLVPGTNVQAYDADLDDLADGSLTGSKVGSGINAANITSGTLALARGGMNADVSGYTNGLYGQISGATADIDTISEFSSALGVTGTPSSSTVLRGDGVWATAPGAISVKEEDSAPTVSSVTEIRVTNGSLTDNGSGSVSLNLSGGGGGGDTISDIASSTNQQITLFNGTTGKHITNYTGTGIITAASGVIGTVTNSAGLAAGLSDETGTGSAVFANAPTFIGPQLGAASASSVTSPIFQSSAGDPADSGVLRLANNEAIAWESSPAGTDMTLLVDASEILTYNGTFNPVTLQESGSAVPNSTDTLSFFAATSSAQLASVISDEIGSASGGRVLFDQSPTLTSPTISGTLTLNNGIAYADASMGALAIDTSEMNNTKSVAVDSTFTFSATPAAGSIFGMQLTNSDAVAHTMTIPSSKSDALGGLARTTFALGPTSTIYMKWRHEGSGVYTVWGDPNTINDLTNDPAPDAAADYVMTFDASTGLHKKVKLNLLPAGSGDAVSVDGAAIVDPNFDDGGDINFASTGSPATVTATVKADSVALGTDTTGNYQAETAAGLGIAVSGAAGEGFTKTVSLDTTAALSGDHTLGANEVRFGQSGLIFEGATANAFEGYISAADIASSDKTWSLPDRSGTFSLSGDTFTGNVTGTLNSSGATALTIANNVVTGAMIAMGSDAAGDILYYNGTDYVRLAAGTTGYVLTAGATPAYVDSATSTQTMQNKDLTNANNTLPAEIVIAASDELTQLTTGNGKVTFRMPYAMTVTSVKASLTASQPSGTVVTVDINENGSANSILGTKLTIPNGTRTSVGGTPATITDSTLADDSEISIDIDSLGAAGASGLKVTIIGTR
jgi:hypothetical protein